MSLNRLFFFLKSPLINVFSVIFATDPCLGSETKSFAVFPWVGSLPSIHGSLTELTNDCFNYQTVAIYGW